MPKLSLIESEATRLVGRVPEAKRRALQQALIDLCEAHWEEIRGPEPETSLAHTLWSVTLPHADLLADLYAGGDGRLDELLQDRKAAQGFALLVLAEIERGNAEGIRLAYDPMMLFDSPAAGAIYAKRIAAALHGEGNVLQLPPHIRKPAFWKALVCIVAHIWRCDVDAVLRVINLLVSHPTGVGVKDESLEHLRRKVEEVGVQFLNLDDAHLRFAVHGHEHSPVSIKQLGNMLGEIRQEWLR